MESLELPQDIIWDGDQSPSLSPNASIEEVLIFEDGFATELIPNDDLIKSNQIFEFSPEEFEQLLSIQQDMESMIEEEEESSNDQWMDQPINVPLDEYAPIPDARIYPVRSTANTADLLNEFNQVYDTVELHHLTPPETPPHTPPQTPLQAYQNDSKNQFYSQPNYQLQYDQQQYQQCKLDEKPMPNYSPAFSVQPQPLSISEQAFNMVQQAAPIEYADNIIDAMAIAEVEALVRSRAEDFADSSIDDDSSTCGSTSCFSPRSDASSSITDDSDWTMKAASSIASAMKSKQKRKPRMNRRSPEDRQSRKKEQNKSAANRYRLKKKAEIEILLDEERELITRNDQLKAQDKKISDELKYTKSLLRELLKELGLLGQIA